jgi:predicted metal-dependent hydrolase
MEPLLDEVRGFLSELRRDFPNLFFAPRTTAVRPQVRPKASRKNPDPIRELFESRVRHWSAIMGVVPRRVFLKNQRSLWGSCSARGNLNFNRALAGAPPEIVDYVVIHELAHLKEMNHSRRFWAVVEAWCPEQKERRRWLRRNAGLLQKS